MMEKSHLDTNYGKCKINPCDCLNPHKNKFNGQWVGTLCPNWRPFNFVSSVDDLMLNAQKIRDIMEDKDD